MQIKPLFGTFMIWAMLACLSFSAPHLHKMKPQRGPDKVAVDEQQSRYPALDLEDLCKQSTNPKCEAVVDSFCLKACSANLCAKHGSIRGMCRLMCEAEDLVPPCLKMGPSKGKKKQTLKKQNRLQEQGGQTAFFPMPVVPLQMH